MPDMPDKPTEDVAHMDEVLPMRQCTPPNPPRGKGLPAGWVTATPGLGRPAQLTALGNGVIPQQAARALQLLALPFPRCPRCATP